MQDKKSQDFVSEDGLKLLTKKKRINSRTKGNSFERKIADILNKHYDTTDFMRTPGSGAFATTHKLPKHLQVEGDLITPKDYPWLIECKKGYKFTISDLMNTKSKFWEIIDKVNNQSIAIDKKPILIFQQNRQDIYCMLPTMNVIHMHGNLDFNFWTIIPLRNFLRFVQPIL